MNSHRRADSKTDSAIALKWWMYGAEDCPIDDERALEPYRVANRLVEHHRDDYLALPSRQQSIADEAYLTGAYCAVAGAAENKHGPIQQR